MNKTHWIAVIIDNSIPDPLIYKWIDASYQLMIENLTGEEQNKLKNFK